VVRSPKPREPGEHIWVDDVCRHCRLRRRETWVQGEEQPVLALMWLSPTREVVRVRPFPPMLGMAPAPGDLVSDAFPDELVGTEPPCPNDPALW
jgi:hypothetical protein